ncbi:lamin tail domain-containing protein [Chitinimonas koreensis]|uniref:lamin tail domain-containing protein n=1 Tax=Chitinimonas koreensis TaxID=356302 RepID=UPI00041ED280|nr:lamin tail domain-containing protein [Chitinimonas koreensis]QNM98553.1 lamin tail domain-containing protein [Chitinimonas koreensis]
MHVPRLTLALLAALALPAGAETIRQIQGKTHVSPYNGKAVSQVTGVVTALRTKGFYMQDPADDGDPATSEGIYVYTNAKPTVAVGDGVSVAGTVSEYRTRAPNGDAEPASLTITEITYPTVTRTSVGNALPAAVRIGPGGRVPPAQLFRADGPVDVEASSAFDAAGNGLDFWESLEGMRVEIADARVTSPTAYSEFTVVPAGAGLMNSRGGITIRQNDFNPERVVVAGGTGTVSIPTVKVGDRVSRVAGVLDYDKLGYRIVATEALAVQAGATSRTVATAPIKNQLAVASFNVENLSAKDAATKFNALGAAVVNNLRSPDIVALMEIQDDSGPADDGTVAAGQTLAKLTAAITAAGGPAYQARWVDPSNNMDGGQPGGNIRLAFLFNPARVGFVDRAGAAFDTAAVARLEGGKLALNYNPVRINPTSAAFASSRKPLVGEFSFNGNTLLVIANHWNSKLGDQPLWGRYQPPARASETQRGAIAGEVSRFVRDALALDPQARVVALGDFNDFAYSAALGQLTAAGMKGLDQLLPESERYTYVYEGNSQAIDHILVSPALWNAASPQYEVVHINAEFPDQISDHDPEVARLDLPAAPLGTLRDVRINEVLPAPTDGREWVELYNPTANAIDLGGASIDDIANGGGAPYYIAKGTMIPARGYWVLERSNYFNNGSDEARLLDAQGRVIDQYGYGRIEYDRSWARVPDGGAWSATTRVPTRGAANR